MLASSELNPWSSSLSVEQRDLGQALVLVAVPQEATINNNDWVDCAIPLRQNSPCLHLHLRVVEDELGYN